VPNRKGQPIHPAELRAALDAGWTAVGMAALPGAT
jgi:hypothetical protein